MGIGAGASMSEGSCLSLEVASTSGPRPLSKRSSDLALLLSSSSSSSSGFGVCVGEIIIFFHRRPLGGGVSDS